MTFRRTLPLVFLTAIALALLVYYPSGASGDNRIGLVIDYGNGQVATRCISFSEETITGFEALERSGLPVETDFQTGGAAVCRIDGQGCPSGDCFCSCRGGGECKYWSYWHLTNGLWNYSSAGSSLYQMHDGMVDGWVWGLGSITQAEPPPLIEYGDICSQRPVNTPTTTMTPSLTPTPIILPTAFPTDQVPAERPTSSATVMTAAGTATAVLTPQSPESTIAGSVITQATFMRPSPTSFLQATPSQESAAHLTPASPPQLLANPDIPNSNLPLEPVAPTLPQPLTTPDPFNGEFGDEGVNAESAAMGTLVGDTFSASTLPDEPLTSDDLSGTGPVAAVVGEDIALIKATPAPISQGDQLTPDFLSYAGFAGLVLLLGALGLVVYHRRTGMTGRQRT